MTQLPNFRNTRKTQPSPAFRQSLKSISEGDIMLPVVRALLSDPSFESFTAEVEGFEMRPPDGWFWPSTHPIWPEPALYQYLVDSSKLISERFDPASTMAVTTGSFIHTFLQTVMVREGVLVQQPKVCGCGREHQERAEVFLIDEEAGTRGHSDGVHHEGSGVELKTMTPMKLDRAPRGGGPLDEALLKWFRVKCPDYYAQAQEYLRMSGRERMIVLITSLTYPYNMREIHIMRDRPYQHEQREKYLRVRSAAEKGQRPRCECGFDGAKRGCPVRCG